MAKRLVVCCDGTWNIPDRQDRGKVRPSNVAKLALALAGEDVDGARQRLFYNKGVGTGPFDRLLGGAFGAGLSKHVQDCYRFLVDNWEPGDEIFLFGFSRGAYTARSTAGLIRTCGILRPENRERLVDGYRLYRRRDDASHPTGLEAELFRKMYSEPTRIAFIGVWDTVGALGIPAGVPWLPMSWLELVNHHWAFHDLKLSSFVDRAYHAIAVDEKRPQFKPTLWEQQEHATNQTMEQVWFVGTHANVGGGYADTGLSDITLLWMKSKAEVAGLTFDASYFEHDFSPNPLGELRESKIGLYDKFPDFLRPIGRGLNSNETVDPSVFERMEENPRYRPPNVESYSRRIAS